MRIVPENRLLLQPTIQLKWIEQHGEIEFVQPKPVLRTFEQVWTTFAQGALGSIPEFLATNEGRSFYLHENDRVFSLLVGADFILKKHPCFCQDFSKTNLIWSIKNDC
jgi:hypothetical protein